METVTHLFIGHYLSISPKALLSLQLCHEFNHQIFENRINNSMLFIVFE